MITYNQFIEAFPQAKVENVAKHYPSLVKAMQQFDINTTLRQAHFLTQAAWETMFFAKMVENMNYSAKGLMATWPKRFTKLEDALPYNRKPEAIGNFVYGGRNGNNQSEGYKYRGRGMFHYTFKSSYQLLDKKFAKRLDGESFVATPELLEQEPWASLSAGYYWDLNKLNSHADKDNLRAIRVAINGGLLGFEECVSILKGVKEVLGC